MSPRPMGPTGLWVFAVEPDRAQITWTGGPPDTVTFRAGDTEHVVDTDGGPGSAILTDLTPGQSYDLRVNGAPGPSFTTLVPPPGEELCRFATMSDIHIGEERFGYFGTMRDLPGHDDAYPVRATRHALTALSDWGAELLAFKGDITTNARVEQWDEFADLLAGSTVPATAIPGNHDARHLYTDRHSPMAWALWVLRGGPIARWLGPETTGTPIAAAAGLARVGLALEGPTAVTDLPGIRVILADTTIQDRHLGSFDEVTAPVVAAAEEARAAGCPVWIGGHHFPMPHDVPLFWPPGVPARDAQRFFTRLATANPRAFYTAGHTHRNRRYTRCGITCTEVGSPKDFPGTWAGYVVHEGGIRQVSYRVDGPDVLPWLDRSKRAGFGLWGAWSPGRLGDRCFSLRW